MAASNSDNLSVKPARYSTVACIFHWVIAGLVLLGLVVGIYGADLESDFGEALIDLHKLVGLSVLALTIMRIGWRLTHRPPPLPAFMLRWQTQMAKLVHDLFYILLLALPLSGWLLTSAFPKRHPIRIGDFAQVPYLPVSPDLAVAQAAHQFHELAGWLMMALIVLHVGAALKHQFYDNHSILGRMNPRRAD